MKALRRYFATASRESPKQYGSFEQSFQIAPRYFLVKYQLKEGFSELKGI